ncbi:MAG: hypothetical protein PHP45_00775 [Elusimicrobiales bacterium]|nr:hypothetical protein [Elusimicrobiales bacterium]
MGNIFIIAFSLAVMVAGAYVTKKNSKLPNSTTIVQPSETLLSIQAISNQFLNRAAQSGLILSFVPEIREWTRPSLISWRQEARAVAVPNWSELSETQHALLLRMAGTGNDELLFNYLFRWFFVPHELSHALETNLGGKHDNAASEQLANDIAVAFYMEQEVEQKLMELERILENALPNLPPLPDTPDYFNKHYQEMGQNNLPLYAAYQTTFVLNSIHKRKNLSLDLLFKELVNSKETKIRN